MHSAANVPKDRRLAFSPDLSQMVAVIGCSAGGMPTCLGPKLSADTAFRELSHSDKVFPVLRNSRPEQSLPTSRYDFEMRTVRFKVIRNRDTE
jgi:hypothetical protein